VQQATPATGSRGVQATPAREDWFGMFGFLLGIVLGAIGGAAYGSRYFKESDVQTQFGDTQERLTNLMSEVRSVLDETRVELRQAWGQVQESAEDKAKRLQQAAAPQESSDSGPGSAARSGDGIGMGTTSSGSSSAPGMASAPAAEASKPPTTPTSGSKPAGSGPSSNSSSSGAA